MRSIALLTIIAALGACKDYPDPLVNTVESISFQNNAYDQKGFAGSYLNDSILVYARDNFGYWAISGYQVRFRVVKGGGETDEEVVLTDRFGKASTRWKLGELSNDQQLEASLFSNDGKKLSTLNFSAFGFKSDKWDATTASPEISITDMAADTINGLTFAIPNNGLLRRGERYFDWVQVNSYIRASPRTIDIAGDLTFYISTWEGQVYKSIDHGLNWLSCKSPWSDYFYYIDLKVTSGNYLWVTAPDKLLLSSRDGGNSWIPCSEGLPATERLGDIFRLTDGTLFLLSLNYGFYKSIDDGHSWTKMNAPQYPLKLYVTEKNELILFNRDNGISIYKSTDKGDHFMLKYTVMPEFNTLMEHTVHKRGKDYYLLIPGYGILHTLDFESFDNFWKNTSVYDLNMDDKGVFLVRGQYGDPVYYRHNSLK
jgi:hypothetical protein